MNEFSEIIERLKDIISSEMGERKVYDKDVAEVLGISPATFATMKKRGSIPFREIMEYCARNRISINWLFFDQPAEMLVEETGKFFRIRYFSQLRASAGGGADVFDEEFEYLKMDASILENIIEYVDVDSIDAIHVTGESMEPTLEDGSIVLVDRSRRDISKDGIFVVSSGNGLFIKRVRFRVDGMIELISDNKIYSPEIVSPSDLRVLGRVVGNITRI